MKLNENNYIQIADVTFSKPDKEQLTMITSYFQETYKQGFFKRLMISLVAAILVIISESIGRKNIGTMNTIPAMIAAVSVVFVIFNVLSYLYSRIKSNMGDIVNKYECTTGVITEKFDSRNLSRKSQQNVPNYILFSNEQGHCVTALSTKNLNYFRTLKVSDEILIIRYCPMGNYRYEFLKLNGTN